MKNVFIEIWIFCLLEFDVVEIKTQKNVVHVKFIGLAIYILILFIVNPPKKTI